MHSGALTPPAPLAASHVVEDFSCGEPSLDHWLKRRALPNQSSGASRCFVVCRGDAVIGYYALAAGALAHAALPKPLRRNMPDPIPVPLLGRLAVDQRHQQIGLGSALLRDAMLRAAVISRETGVAAILLHAISEAARRYYLSRGFVESPVQRMTLLMTLATIRQILSEPDG